MALSEKQKIIRDKEIKIGTEAAKLATRFLHRNINRSFKVRNAGGFFHGKKVKPMLSSTKVKPKVGEYLLLGLDATSNKYAFMHHYGFKGKRIGTMVRFSHRRFKNEFTSRDSHLLNLRNRSIFTNLYAESGAKDYLIKHLSETRTESYKAKFDDLIVKISQDE